MTTRFSRFVTGSVGFSVSFTLVMLLVACNSSDTSVQATSPITQATNTAIAARTNQPVEPSTATSLSSTAVAAVTTIQSLPAVGKSPLDRDVKQSDQIVIAKVENIGELVWTTPDGKEPVNVNDNKYSTTSEQLAPVQLSINTLFKGNLQPGQKVTVYLSGAPNSKPYGASKGFPNDFLKVGETRLWFFNKEKDLRQGTNNNPLISLMPKLYYILNSDTRLYAPNGNILTIAELESAIKNPAPEMNTVVKPSPTPEVQVGQNLNLVKLYQLDKTQSIVLKSASRNVQITDAGEIKAIIATLDKSLTANSDPNMPTGADVKDLALIVFTSSDVRTISFEYNRITGALTHHDSINPVKVLAPNELAQALGLK